METLDKALVSVAQFSSTKYLPLGDLSKSDKDKPIGCGSWYLLIKILLIIVFIYFIVTSALFKKTPLVMPIGSKDELLSETFQ